jgi:hypothetical protein
LLGGRPRGRRSLSARRRRRGRGLRCEGRYGSTDKKSQQREVAGDYPSHHLNRSPFSLSLASRNWKRTQAYRLTTELGKRLRRISGHRDAQELSRICCRCGVKAPPPSLRAGDGTQAEPNSADSVNDIIRERLKCPELESRRSLANELARLELRTRDAGCAGPNQD